MKILVVDDHALIREALRGVLLELKPEAGVIDASSCREALELAQANAAELDLVLLDLGLPDGDGFDTLGELRDLYPAVAIVVLSAAKDRDSVTKALDLGALGFIPKSASRAVMVSALQLVFAGGIYVPPEISTAPTNGSHERARICPAVALRAWADGTTNRRACTHDAGEEQQGCLP